MSLSFKRVIEIAYIETEQFIVISVYSRPPCAPYENFANKMEEVMFNVSKSKKNIVICGDFNNNILATSSLSYKFLTYLELQLFKT